MSISDQLTTEELDRMKFVVKLPQGTLEDVQKPFELFRRMMNAKLLSAENRVQLASLLQFAGRVDLRNKLMHHHLPIFNTTEGELKLFAKSLVYLMLLNLIANQEELIELAFILRSLCISRNVEQCKHMYYLQLVILFHV